MKKITLLLATLLATACGQKLDPAAIRAAMPASSVVRIDAPDPRATAGVSSLQVTPARRLAASEAAAAQQAPLAVTSYVFATAVNGGVFWTLAPIAWLTQVVPPTSCTDTACTWGPGADQAELNRWTLVVTKAGAGYDYVLSGQPKAPAGAPFVPVISGRAFPGVVEHRGHGSFEVDFDAVWAGLAHPDGAVQQDFGTLAVDYDARTAVHLDVSFLDARNGDDPGVDPANPNRANAVYSFDATAAGGDLQLGWHTAAPYSADYLDEQVGLHTRWDAAAGGAGRGDFRYARVGAALEFSQCWDGAPSYAMTFDGSGPSGDAAACAFAQAAPPTITVP